jgi:predicted MFS family arabinose efflux permease
VSRRPLIAMSVAYFMILSAGFGTGGLWPVYVVQLGGGPAAAGILNAFSGPANVIAALLCGWLVTRVPRRKPIFYASCLLFAGTWFLMSRATTWQQLAGLNFLCGLAFGMTTNLIIIFTGLLAAATERGRSFGVLTFVSSASLLTGGLLSGVIADRWGFPALLTVNMVVCLLALIPGALFVEPPVPPRSEKRAGSRGALAALGKPFALLWGACLFMYLASFASTFGRGMTMSQLGFSATAVSLATAIGGAIALPAPLVIGWLSDRMGRKRLLLGCLAVGVAAMFVMSSAGSTWGFWAASALLAVMMTAQPLMQAFATDLLPAGSVSIGLALLSVASSFALTASSLGIGIAIESVGAQISFMVAALLPLIAMALLLPIRESTGREEAVATTTIP